MPKYVVYFRCEQVLSGDIEIEAETPEEAMRLFYKSETGTPIDDARLEAKLDLNDSFDSVVQIDVRTDDNDLIPVWTESEDGDEDDLIEEDSPDHCIHGHLSANDCGVCGNAL